MYLACELHLEVWQKIKAKASLQCKNVRDFAGEIFGEEDIQNQDKGQEMNRKLSKFPHYSFRQMLEYKCKERGIKYVEVSEAYTSQRCSRCGEKGNRYRRVFRCSSCGLEFDSDANGAKNIMRRALGSLR